MSELPRLLRYAATNCERSEEGEISGTVAMIVARALRDLARLAEAGPECSCFRAEHLPDDPYCELNGDRA